jgi:hypothetical protein
MQALPVSNGPASPVAEPVNPGLKIALWLAIVAQFGLILISLVLAALSLPPGISLAEGLAEPLAFGVVTLAFPTVGAICLLRRPSQPVGWLLSVVALGWALANAATGYAQYARSASPATLPGIEWALWLSGNSWTIVASQGVLLMLLLLFPTGSLISSRWRPVAWLVVGWTVVSVFAVAFAGGTLDDMLGLGIANPAAAPEPVGAVLRALAGWLPYCFILLFAVGAIALGLRFRGSRGVERQQLKWIAVAAPVVVVALAVTFGALALLGAQPTSGAAAPTGWLLAVGIVGTLSPGLLPVAIGIAILRYRLYDIDRLINRALVYGVLTATLAASYVGVIAVLQVVLQPFTRGSQLTIAASTLVVAALFQPLRARIQRAVDRRFYRSRYNAERTVERFAGRLRDELDLAALSAELIGVVGETVRPARAGLWLRGRS